MAELIGGSGYDDVQDTEPSNPSIGDTWFDESEQAGKIYADFGGGGGDWHVLPVQDELQNGRTRTLLLLLQDNPVPEVVDPLNIQSGLSQDYTQGGDSDYRLGSGSESTINISMQSGYGAGRSNSGLTFNPNKELSEISFKVAPEENESVDNIEINKVSDGTTIGSAGSVSPSNTASITGTFKSGTDYALVGDTQSDSAFNDSFSAKSTTLFDVPDGYNEGQIDDVVFHFSSITGYREVTVGYVTDRFDASTASADFQQWSAIQARDVTTGGSTSAEPVEFEILDSSDTVLNSSKIPKARIADEPFTMRNRLYSEDAGSDGQSDYQIATTGDGGHFGIPVLTVVSVKKNGSVLDSANWSFDGTDTVTIDTSNVTIASGDTIEIKYDFDVFDSTLQPRAYLSREDGGETSPSISHFRYEYVI